MKFHIPILYNFREISRHSGISRFQSFLNVIEATHLWLLIETLFATRTRIISSKFENSLPGNKWKVHSILYIGGLFYFLFPGTGITKYIIPVAFGSMQNLRNSCRVSERLPNHKSCLINSIYLFISRKNIYFSFTSTLF